MNRDFKGVWIPKNIWLNTELTMLEKVIFIEIDSLDNEDNCVAGNEYFAEFCNCSVSKVSKAISKLKELNMIEEISFDGRHRKLRVVKNTTQGCKKYNPDLQILPSNNINNKKENKKVLPKGNTTGPEFNFGKSKPQKQNLYSKCLALIDNFTNDTQIRLDLTEYLNVLLEMKADGYNLYINVWKGILRKLNEISTDPKIQHKIISQSIERGYKSFYPVKNYNNRQYKSPDGLNESESMTEQDYINLKKVTEERKRNGLRTSF